MAKPAETNTSPSMIVDLDALQQRSLAGEHVDVYREIYDAVPEEWVEQAFHRRHGKNLVMNPNNTVGKKKRRLVANEEFVHIMQEGIQASTDVETFKWRTSTFLDRIDDLDGYIDLRKKFAHTTQTFDKDQLKNRTFLYLYQFTEDYPDLKDEAIKAWEEAYFEEGVSGGEKIRKLHKIIQSLIVESEENTDIPEAHRVGMEEMIAGLEEKYTWENGTTAAYESSESLQTRMATLELVPYTRIGIKKLDELYERLQNPDIKSRDEAKLISQSARASLVFVRRVVAAKPELADGIVGKIHEGMEKAESEGGISYLYMVRLGNLITPILRDRVGQELSSLDIKDLTEYPKGVERVVELAFNEFSQLCEDDQQLEVFRRAADCIKLAAQRGTIYKAKQRVLTIGDILLRHTGLSREQQEKMIATYQGKNVGAAAIQSVYDEQRSLSQRSHARFNRWRAGYGRIS